MSEDGHFLVRESQAQDRRQFVLTGRENGCHKHLLLVDPDGVVRTIDRAFDSVSHLVEYHRLNFLPIISEAADSAVFLRHPVEKISQAGTRSPKNASPNATILL